MGIQMKSNTNVQKPRKASRQIRRQQLIEATIITLAEKGQARLKLQDVAETAGLSYGLVNFYFETKEKLLTETLQFMGEEYKANWQDALSKAGDDPAIQLDALIKADFNSVVSTRDRVLAWYTFWGEAQGRPQYQEQCGANDQEYIRILEGICSRLVAATNSALKPEQVARVIRVTIEGVWFDLMTMSVPYSRQEAMRTVYCCAMAFFPKYFTGKGLKR
jgi:TetR/AcrR family transcriptional regulator, transcriptional repressor of bet genes